MFFNNLIITSSKIRDLNLNFNSLCKYFKIVLVNSFSSNKLVYTMGPCTGLRFKNPKIYHASLMASYRNKMF